MRILLVVEPGIDGVFRHVEGLAHFLVAQNLELHLAYSDRRGSEPLQKLVTLIEERGGECLNLGVGNAPEWRDAGALWRLWSMVRRVCPDVVHAHSSKAGVLARSLALLGVRAKFYYSPHAYYGLAPRSGPRVHFYNAVEWALGRIGTTINISKDEAAFAMERLRIAPEKIRVIHNPVNPDVFAPAGKEARARNRARLGIPRDALVLGWIGRLSFQKDPQTLYRSIAPVLAARDDLVLFQVGQGELDEELQRMARDLGIAPRIVRHGYFNEPAVFYETIDALIMTSRYEAGWPIVVLEALASGLPLMVSEAPGTTDIGAAGLSHCWTAPSAEPVKFSRAIEAWLADIPRQRSSNHREIAVDRFTPAKAFGAVLEEYRRAS